MAKLNEVETTAAINLISNGTDITGNVNSGGDIRIDGSLNGNLTTKGKVVVGPSGKVKGEIICKNLEVSGSIEGKVSVDNLLNLKASSKIYGEITTSRLSIEPGAVFTGNCKMSEDVKNGGTLIPKGKEGDQ